MDKFSSSSYVQTIADLRSISAAAEKLGISQPALSAFLKKQEEQTGAVLFDRAKQPLELTEAGRVYIQYADKYIALSKEFSQHISDIQDLKTGALTIGGASFFNISYLPKAVAEFTGQYPGIDVEIVDGNIPEISTKALNGQLDLFISPPWGEDDRFQYEELLQEKILVCVPPEWKINEALRNKEITPGEICQGRISTDKCVDFKTFKDLPFVLLKENQHIGHVMTSLFHKNGFEPKRWVSVEQTMTSHALTLAGVGISLITESSIRNSSFKDFPKFYMADPEICVREIYVAYPKQKYLSKAAKEFINILKINV